MLVSMIFDLTTSVLPGSTVCPSTEIGLLRYGNPHLKKLHCDVLILIRCFLSCCSTSLKSLRCSSKIFENIRRSSKYGIANLSLESPRQCSINIWNVASAFINPTRTLTHL